MDLYEPDETHGPDCCCCAPADEYSEPASTEPAYAEPAYTEVAYVEPAYVEPAYVEPAYSEPAYVEPQYVEAAHVEPTVGVDLSSPAPVVAGGFTEMTIGGGDLSDLTESTPLFTVEPGNLQELLASDAAIAAAAADEAAIDAIDSRIAPAPVTLPGSATHFDTAAAVAVGKLVGGLAGGWDGSDPTDYNSMAERQHLLEGLPGPNPA